MTKHIQIKLTYKRYTSTSITHIHIYYMTENNELLYINKQIPIY